MSKNNEYTWKETKGKTISLIVVGALFFVGTMSVWFLLSSIATGQGR